MFLLEFQGMRHETGFPMDPSGVGVWKLGEIIIFWLTVLCVIHWTRATGRDSGNKGNNHLPGRERGLRQVSS